jgi:lactoylglutathione lyase
MPLIHTCYRITDIDRSIAFYEALSFAEVGRIPIGDEAINVFMNQPGDGDMPRLELTYNFGVDSYDIGSAANLDLYSLAWAADGTRQPAQPMTRAGASSV